MDEIVAVEQAIALVQDRDFSLSLRSDELIDALRNAQSLIVKGLLWEMKEAQFEDDLS